MDILVEHALSAFLTIEWNVSLPLQAIVAAFLKILLFWVVHHKCFSKLCETEAQTDGTEASDDVKPDVSYRLQTNFEASTVFFKLNNSMIARNS